MKVLIFGMDGYIGYPLYLKLMENHTVVGVDNLIRRERVRNEGGCSVTPIPMPRKRFADDLCFGDATNYYTVSEVIKGFKPDVIVHLAHQPSAPYSMKSPKTASETFDNNLTTTCNILWAMRKYAREAHLITIGTLGEYADWIYDGIPIPESDVITVLTHRQRPWRIPVPREGSSLYHLSKTAMSTMIRYACRIWGLKATDIMQGIVYGVSIDPTPEEDRLTRFDVDATWGTIINRFTAMSIIQHPLTVYGKGGQTRGIISIKDSVNAIKTLIENPPEEPQYRVVNQFHEVYTIKQIAYMVAEVAEKVLGHSITIKHVQNPRKELERHVYQPEAKLLRQLGVKPLTTVREEVERTIEILMNYKQRIPVDKLMPDVKWC